MSNINRASNLTCMHGQFFFFAKHCTKGHSRIIWLGLGTNTCILSITNIGNIQTYIQYSSQWWCNNKCEYCFKKSLFLNGAKIFQNLKSATSSCFICTICYNLYTQIIFYSLNISSLKEITYLIKYCVNFYTILNCLKCFCSNWLLNFLEISIVMF